LPPSGPPLETQLVRAPGQSPLLPARIMSDEITIINDGVGPVFDSVTATQVQPYSDEPAHAVPVAVNVKNPPTGKVTVRTFDGIPNAEATTATGPVVITVQVHDSGVGLASAPSLVLTCSGNPLSPVTLTTPNTVIPGSTAVQTFVYQWDVPVGAHGTWTAKVEVSDTMESPHTTTIDPYFTLVVNTYQITGVVELQSFLGVNRPVVFKANDNSAIIWSNVLDLKFTSGPILDAGAWQDRATAAAKLFAPDNAFLTWLRYGSFPNLAGVVERLRLERAGEHKNVDAHINYLLYGRILNLPSLAYRLANPDSRIEQFASLKLSPATVLALAAYEAAMPTPTDAQAAALSAGILDDFNKIVVGPALWDGEPSVRFQGVAGLYPTVTSPTAAYWLSTVDTNMQNRTLLRLSFAEYVPGMLNAAAASALTDYANGLAVPGLEALLLKAFDDVTLNVFKTPDPFARNTLWPAGQTAFPGLYNQFTFVNVSLGADTYDQLTGPALTGPDLTQLNQNLLRDAYKEFGQPAMYEEAKIRPDTVLTLSPLDAAAFEAKMQRDLNAVIYGPSIWDGNPTTPYNTKRFPSGAIIPGGELALLIAGSPAAGTPDCVRMNRLLIELGFNRGTFPKVITDSVQAPYVLINIPEATKQLSAKTAWNLRETLAGLAFAPLNVIDNTGLDTTAYFVTDGVPGWLGADHFLRGGDIDGSVGDPVGDDIISLWDYNVMRLGYMPVNAPAADVNGDGKVNRTDYNILQGNWTKQGDAEVIPAP